MSEQQNEIKHWFASDFHLGHKNIINYDQRPFKNVWEMNKTIVNNHNEVVGNNDNFYFLGDLSFTIDKGVIEGYLSSLRGNKFFIKGNHDHRGIIKLYEKYGQYLGQLSQIRIGLDKIVLCHYKMMVWNKSHRGSYHLYGHSHGSAEHLEIGRSMDVGIMLNNYYPFEWNEIKSRLDTRKIQEIDHHTAEH